MLRSRVLVLLIPLLTAAQPAGAQRFVPGEVMAQFVPGSEASALVERARHDPENLSALEPTATLLGASVGVRLTPSRIASGNWLVFSIDSEALVDRIRGQMAARDNVEAAEIRDRVSEGPGQAATRKVVVTFSSGSPEAQATAAKLSGADDALVATIASLEREVGLPLTARPAGRTELEVQLDLRALTLYVVERFKALPYVESAQPNYMLVRM